MPVCLCQSDTEMTTPSLSPSSASSSTSAAPALLPAPGSEPNPTAVPNPIPVDQAKQKKLDKKAKKLRKLDKKAAKRQQKQHTVLMSLMPISFERRKRMIVDLLN